MLGPDLINNKPGKATKLSDKNCQLHDCKERGQAKVFVAQKLKSVNVSHYRGDGWRRSDVRVIKLQGKGPDKVFVL